MQEVLHQLSCIRNFMLKKKPDEFHAYEIKNIVVEEAKRNMKLFSHNKLQGKCFIICIL